MATTKKCHIENLTWEVSDGSPCLPLFSSVIIPYLENKVQSFLLANFPPVSKMPKSNKKSFHLVYFLLLPTGKIKIGESSILRFADRFDEAQRYFQKNVKPLKIIRFSNKSSARKMESFYKRRFKRKREIFDATPRLLKFMERRKSKRTEDAIPYLKHSRELRKKERKRKRLIKLIITKLS